MAKKTTSAKSAPKSEATPKAWNAGKKVVHHGVRVTGPGIKGASEFPSTWKAFLGLGLAKGEEWGPCVKFRKSLKASKDGELPFVKDGKTYNFTLVSKAS